MKTLLVHGYATKLQASFFRKPLGENEGFEAYKKRVSFKEAFVFHWGKFVDLPLILAMNPLSYLRLYREEESLALAKETQRQLFETIERLGAEQIIAHSMGARLLIEMMNDLGIPNSISSIIFLQADIDEGQRITNQNILDRIESKTLIIQNYHCFWDPTLLLSSIIHKKHRAGIRGWTQGGVQNIFSPLTRLPNLHTSHLHDRELADQLMK